MIRGKDGMKPSQYPTYNLSNPVWKTAYEHACTKLAQEARPHLKFVRDPQVRELINRMGSLYERIKPEFYKDYGQTREYWLDKVSSDPLELSLFLSAFGRQFNMPQFENASQFLHQEILAAGGGEGFHEGARAAVAELSSDPSQLPYSTSQSRTRHVPKMNPELLDKPDYGNPIIDTADVVGDLALSGLGRIGALASFVPNIASAGYNALAARGHGAHEAQFTLPTLSAVAPKLMRLVDFQDANMDVNAAWQTALKAHDGDPKRALNDPNYKRASEYLNQTFEDAQQAYMDPDIALDAQQHYADFINKTVGPIAATASRLTSMRASPLLGSIFSGMKHYQDKYDLLSRAVAHGSRKASSADSDIVGKIMIGGKDSVDAPVYGYPAGTEITPEIREDLISRGADDLWVVEKPTLMKNLAPYMMAGGKTYRELQVIKGMKAMEIAKYAKKIPGGVARLLGFGKAVDAASDIAKSVGGAVETLGKVSKVAKMGRAVPIVGNLLGAVADGADAYIYTFMKGSSKLRDEDMLEFAKSNMNENAAMSVIKTIGSVPLALINTAPLRTRLMWAVPRMLGYTEGPVEAKLRERRDFEAISRKEAETYQDLNQLSPGIGFYAPDTAMAIAQNRFETSRGRLAGDSENFPERDQYARPISKAEMDIIDSLPEAYSGARAILRDLSREAGDAVIHDFFTRGVHGNIVPKPGMIQRLQTAAEKGMRWQSPELKSPEVVFEWQQGGQRPSALELDPKGIRYYDPRYHDPDYRRLEAIKRRQLMAKDQKQQDYLQSQQLAAQRKVDESQAGMRQRLAQQEADNQRMMEANRAQSAEIEQRRMERFRAGLERTSRNIQSFTRQTDRAVGVEPQPVSNDAQPAKPFESPEVYGKSNQGIGDVPPAQAYAAGAKNWIDSQIGGG